MGRRFGLKKFDPFTLACYHGLIQIGYLVGGLGILEMEIGKLNYDNYILSITFAVLLIGLNFSIIKKIGIIRLESEFRAERKTIKIILDILIMFYIVAAFILINYVRSKNAVV